MTVFIRNGVFETNSSGTHALNINPNAVRDFSEIADSLKSGVLLIDINRDFGGAWERIYTIRNKIAYLICQEHEYGPQDAGDAREKSPEEMTQAIRSSSARLAKMFDAIEEATGARLLVKVSTDDCEVSDPCDESCYDLFTNGDILLDFIFDKKSYIQFEYGYDGTPAKIETDRGMPDEGFPEHYTDAPCDGVQIAFWKNQSGRCGVIFPNGTECATGIVGDPRAFRLALNKALSGFVVEAFNSAYGDTLQSAENHLHAQIWYLRAGVGRVHFLRDAKIEISEPNPNLSWSETPMVLKGRLPEENLPALKAVFERARATSVDDKKEMKS